MIVKTFADSSLLVNAKSANSQTVNRAWYKSVTSVDYLILPVLDTLVRMNEQIRDGHLWQRILIKIIWSPHEKAWPRFCLIERICTA